MKIVIKSKQIYEDYEDEILESYDAEILYVDNGFKLVYNDTTLYFDGECVFLKRPNFNLEIRVGIKTISKLITPYRDIQVEVMGKKINFVKSPFEIDFTYSIKVGNTEEYINELQIYDCAI